MFAVKAGILIATVDAVYEQYGFLVENGAVQRILKNAEIDALSAGAPGMEVLDASNKIVMPGFVNAHMHQYGTLSHGMPADVENFQSFLDDYWWPHIENRLGKREVEATALWTAAEMLYSGITAFCDTLEAPFSGRGILSKQAKAVEKTGMRAVLSIESCERVDTQNGLDCLRENASFVRERQKAGGRISGMLCTHTSFTCSADFLKKAAALAEETGNAWQFHLSESAYEPSYCLEATGMRPAMYYDSLGLLGEQVLASQCVQIDEAEIELLAKRGVRAVHMPLSNCEVGGGFAPVPQMLDAGMTVGLGTDGYVNNFFEVMRGAFLMHKANLQNAQVMPAARVFRMATEYAAKAVGLEDCGKLTAGSRADFTVLSRRFPTPVTRTNLFDQIVLFGNPDKVENVYVEGEPLVADGKICSFDEEAARRNLLETAAAFWEET